MNRNEFARLPPAIALAILFDCLDEGTVEALKAKVAPEAPSPPRFDLGLYGSNGITFASECSLKQIDWHLDRALKSAEGGGQYAEKDAIKAKKLREWRIWRGCFPGSVWVGKRGDEDAVVAAPPSDRPRVYPRQGGNGGQQRQQQQDDDIDPSTF